MPGSDSWKNTCVSGRDQPLVGGYDLYDRYNRLIFIITSETPYNVRETPKASDTKPGVETRSAAELIALGMVRIQRIIVHVGDLVTGPPQKTEMGNPRVKNLHR